MTPSPTATYRPEPEIMLEVPTPRLFKLRKAMRQGFAEYSRSRRIRLAIAAHDAAEREKMAKFLRNCAMNGRIEMTGW